MFCTSFVMVLVLVLSASIADNVYSLEEVMFCPPYTNTYVVPAIVIVTAEAESRPRYVASVADTLVELASVAFGVTFCQLSHDCVAVPPPLYVVSVALRPPTTYTSFPTTTVAA